MCTSIETNENKLACIFKKYQCVLCDLYRSVLDKDKAKKEQFTKIKLEIVKEGSEEWEKIKGTGYCAYEARNNRILIGLPYPYNKEADLPNNKEADLPIERAVLHELGHHMQNVIYGATIQNCNKNILEIHNIIFHENLVNTPAGGKCLYFEGYRYTYENSDKTQLTIYKWQLENTKKQLSEAMGNKEFNDVEKCLLNEINDRVNRLNCENIKNGYNKSLMSLVRNMLVKI